MSQQQDEQQTPDFEAALGELEKLVEAMEQGDVSLEDSLRMFERGVTLARQCQAALQSAERKIQILVDKDGEQILEDFDSGKEQPQP